MARPTKRRRVEFLPEITYFKPAGVPMKKLEETVITIEEVEALRLKDYEGLEQEECAQKMGVSRPTFSRIINTARQKVADAIINGKAIRVGGGNFKISHPAQCQSCGYIWEETLKSNNMQDIYCPSCHSGNWIPKGGRFRHRGGKKR